MSLGLPPSSYVDVYLHMAPVHHWRSNLGPAAWCLSGSLVLSLTPPGSLFLQQLPTTQGEVTSTHWVKKKKTPPKILAINALKSQTDPDVYAFHDNEGGKVCIVNWRSINVTLNRTKWQLDNEPMSLSVSFPKMSDLITWFLLIQCSCGSLILLFQTGEV